MTSEWTICVTPMPTEEALDIAARIADAEEPDCEDLLLTEGARVCDVLRCEVLHQAEVIERRTAELSTATGEFDRLRAAIERHEAAARVHAEERAGLCAELARVTGERDAAECERDALYDAALEWARAEDALTAAIVADDGPDTDGAYAAAVTRRNAAHVALRAATVTP